MSLVSKGPISKASNKKSAKTPMVKSKPKPKKPITKGKQL